MITTRLAIEVVAGLVPGGSPESEFTKVFTISSNEWSESTNQAVLLAEIVGKAQGYAAMLMNSPSRVNWVRMDWIWF